MEAQPIGADPSRQCGQALARIFHDVHASGFEISKYMKELHRNERDFTA